MTNDGIKALLDECNQLSYLAISDTGHSIPSAFAGSVDGLRRYFAALALGAMKNAFIKNVLLGRDMAGKTSLFRTANLLFQRVQSIQGVKIEQHELDRVHREDFLLELANMDAEAFINLFRSAQQQGPTLTEEEERTITLDLQTSGPLRILDMGGQSDYLPWTRAFLTPNELDEVFVDLGLIQPGTLSEPDLEAMAEDVFLSLGGRVDGVGAAETEERKRSFLRSCDWCLRRARGEEDTPPKPGQAGDLSKERAAEFADTLLCCAAD